MTRKRQIRNKGFSRSTRDAGNVLFCVMCGIIDLNNELLPAVRDQPIALGHELEDDMLHDGICKLEEFMDPRLRVDA